MLKLRKNKKGFTLVELIVVIAIMAVLAGTVAGVTVTQLNKQTNNSAKTEVDGLINDFKTFVLDYPEQISADNFEDVVKAFADEAKATKGGDILDTSDHKAGEHKFKYTINELTVTFSCKAKGTGNNEISASYTYTDVLA